MPEKPRLLIEQWLPIAEIGAECMRERGASSALPPLYFLHVWWARRPLTVSRAAILASLLPAYPTGENGGVRPWPQKFLKTFPTFDAYKAWFLRLIGIVGDPVAARKLLEYAARKGIRVPNPYEGPRAFTVNPDEQQLKTLYDLLEWTWGTREITFCDPMAGGGSIPFEALRYGLTVHANELNPVASVILKATLDYPARFGPDLVQDIRKYGRMWVEKVQKRLRPFYTDAPDDAIGVCYLWARTVACPATGKPVPLSPNWWLRKGSDPMAVRLIADPKSDHCRFEIVKGKAACERAKPDQGTVRRGTGVSPWTNETINGDYIKAEAKAGRMGEQLYAVGIKKAGDFSFRPPTAEDEAAYERAVKELKKRLPEWEAKGLIPNEPRREGRADWACEIYGITRWAQTYAPRQLLAMATFVDAAQEICEAARSELPKGKDRDKRLEAIGVALSIAVNKAADYNSRQVGWDPTFNKIAHAFGRHDLSMRWSFGEFDASRNLAPWVLDQVCDATRSMVELAYHPTLFDPEKPMPVERLRFTTGPAQHLAAVRADSVGVVCVDPPYYDNVNYAECSNYFYVWHKRVLADVFPDLFATELTNEDDEAVMNPTRFKDAGRNAKALALADYENKMMACFRECHRTLAGDGVMTVMFNHKQVDAWDTLGMALLRAGFKIDASWPVHTESEHSLHQAKKNAAASTILLVCRKRDKGDEPVWWDDLKGEVRTRAREAAERFEKEGIRGVDLYISTFGPVLAVISERWPVLTSQTDPKTGDPLPLKPGDALDLARQEVINLRKRGLLLGRTVEFDPVTVWYLMAWDAFRAEEFPADEARKLALALGLDLEADIIRDKRLVSKKSASVVLNLPSARRKRSMVDPEVEGYPHVLDALHTAMMIYAEEGSKACQVFMTRSGLATDSRLKTLVEAAMKAIPTTRDKQGKFLRPEMETLEKMRLLFWSDLAPPKEEEPKPPEQLKLLETEEPEENVEDEDAEEDSDEE